MDSPIVRAEYEEFKKRIEEHDCRQDKRIQILEEHVEQLKKLNTSIEKLAVNMENMLKEQLSQGNRLQELEERDGKMWRTVIGYGVTTVFGIIIGYVFQKLGVQ